MQGDAAPEMMSTRQRVTFVVSLGIRSCTYARACTDSHTCTHTFLLILRALHSFLRSSASAALIMSLGLVVDASIMADFPARDAVLFMLPEADEIAAVAVDAASDANPVTLAMG